MSKSPNLIVRMRKLVVTFGSGVADDGAGEVEGPGVGSVVDGTICRVAERRGRLEELATGVSGTSVVVEDTGGGKSFN